MTASKNLEKKRRRGDRKDFSAHKKLYYTRTSGRVGNILWLTLGGWVVPFYFLFVGALYLLTVIGAKKAYACFRFAQFSLLPFGVEIRLNFEKKKFGNLFWIVTTGWPIALVSLAFSLVFYATIVGAPIGEQWRKLSRLSMCPFGAKFAREKPSLRLSPVNWFSRMW